MHRETVRTTAFAMPLTNPAFPAISLDGGWTAQ